MSNKKKSASNVPNLRFPGFEGEWEVSDLGYCSSSLDYGMNAAATVYDGENGYIRITDIDEKSSKYKSENPVSPTGILEEKYLVKENDILLVRTGASTGKSYLYDSVDGKLYFAGFLIRARVKNDYNAKFIFTQTQTENYNKWVALMSMRSGQPGINSQEYSSFNISLPTSRKEQDKIAEFITRIDNRIHTQSKIIEQLETLINIILNDIFKQKLGFKEPLKNELIEWKEISIGDLMKIGSGKDYKHLQGGNIPVFGTGGYMTSVNDYLFDGETVCIGRKGTIDKPMYYHGKLWTVDTLFYTHSYQNCIPKFIYYLFRSINWLNYNEASGVPSLSKSTIERIKVRIPSLSQQLKLSNFISSIDQKIQTEKAILEQLEKQKKYLLQKMFV